MATWAPDMVANSARVIHSCLAPIWVTRGPAGEMRMAETASKTTWYNVETMIHVRRRTPGEFSLQSNGDEAGTHP